MWSPDSTRIAFSDKRLGLWYVDVAKGAPVKVDSDYYEGASFNAAWAPDSKWLAYTKQLPNHLHAVVIYSIEQKKTFQVTDGMSDALYPVFDRNGQVSVLHRQHRRRALRRRLRHVERRAPDYAERIRGRARQGSAIAARAGKRRGKDRPGKASATDADTKDDKTKDDKPKDDKAKEKPVVVKIDPAGIGQRILALPVPRATTSTCCRGKPAFSTWPRRRSSFARATSRI